MTIENLIREAYTDFSETEKIASEKSINVDECKKISESLTKVSSLPYSQEAYSAVCGVMKIASTAINDMLNGFQTEKQKNSELEKVSGIRSMIDDMLEKGLISKFDIQEKTAALLKKNENELAVVKEAISLTSDNMSGNIFDSETEKTSSVVSGKKEMFEGIV